MWTGLDTFVFEEEFVLLSEGPADRAFFEKLAEAKKIPAFDFPWPIDGDAVSAEQQKLHGKSGFVDMLKMFNRLKALHPIETERTKGILIVADACDKPEDTFTAIKQQITNATKFGVPNAALELAKSKDGNPTIAVMLMPPKGSGSLRTLCVKHLSDRHKDVATCMESYLKCEGVAKSMKEWNAEKTDKAKLQTLVAVVNKDDPNKTIRRLFSTTKTVEARINVTDPCFIGPLDVAARCVWRAVAGEAHDTLLGEFSVAELGHSTICSADWKT